MFKIVLTGPESTGKTTLAAQLAEHFGTVWVPEFARAYLDGLNRPYRQDDLLEIARGQIAQERDFLKKAKELLFFDTSLEVVKVWSEFRYGNCDPWILEQLEHGLHDLYLLCSPDLAWTFDPQREHPQSRDALFEIYRKDLTQLNVPFFELRGLGEERLRNAVAIVEDFLKNKGYNRKAPALSTHPLLLFDGVCNLCNASVQWVIRRDPQAVFRFASLQSETGQMLLRKFKLPADELNTVVLVTGEKIFTRSDVLLQLFKILGGRWNLLRIFSVLPRPVRNAVYDWIAKNRYRWFGKKEACWLPTPDLKERFLD